MKNTEAPAIPAAEYEPQNPNPAEILTEWTEARQEWTANAAEQEEWLEKAKRMYCGC